MKGTFVRILPVFLLLLLALVLVSWGSTEKEYRVMFSLSEGVSVDGYNPISVPDGGSASFRIEIAEGYIFTSCI